MDAGIVLFILPTPNSVLVLVNNTSQVPSLFLLMEFIIVWLCFFVWSAKKIEIISWLLGFFYCRGKITNIPIAQKQAVNIARLLGYIIKDGYLVISFDY